MSTNLLPKDIVLASHNAGKLNELRLLLAPLAINIHTAKDFAIDAIEETGKGFVENALLKARHVSEKTGLAALADDSGLCVDILQGAPGVFSARYADPHSDQANIDKLLETLKTTPEIDRTAYFYCALVLVRHPNDPTPIISEAIWRGRILTKAEGSNGFGYDPIFKPQGHQHAVASLDNQVKQTQSHRAKALMLLKQKLAQQYV